MAPQVTPTLGLNAFLPFRDVQESMASRISLYFLLSDVYDPATHGKYPAEDISEETFDIGHSG